MKSTNEHGVHSPFIYKLVTECFYKKSPNSVVLEIENYRKSIRENKEILTITDLGSGSRVFKGDLRKICDIAKNAGIAKKYALLLNRLVAYLNCETILELGTSLGMGTFSLLVNNYNSNVTSIEGCSETLKEAAKQLRSYSSQLRLIEGDFNNELGKVLESKKYDLIYFDGNHQKEPTLKYFKKCLQSKHNNSVFIFDDIYWSPGMKEAWEEIKKHPQVTVTIDIFQWGLVFFRTEQAKEHFKIRY